ncbi:MAG: nitroreductase family protein [Oscillospiraceae bacterium]|nr:nitroreductase family protein [Oscillospiraceae bacterium]MDD4368757.1 nitroreductase family protein [Oscillospiraceae bacterium]
MDLVHNRRSIRRYLPREVEDWKLKALGEAFRLAPSARNGQHWKLYLVRNPELRAKLRQATTSQPDMLAQAPVIVVAAGLPAPEMACGQSTNTVDLAIACSFVMLEAEELGLGFCWMGSFYAEEVRQALNLPPEQRIVAIAPLGYAAEQPEPRSRLAAEDVVTYL